jgi:hypothetical protein
MHFMPDYAVLSNCLCSLPPVGRIRRREMTSEQWIAKDIEGGDRDLVYYPATCQQGQRKGTMNLLQ